VNVNPKVTAGVLAAAVTTLIVWILSLLGVDMPVVVQGAITTLLSGVAGYMTPASNSPVAHEAE
jgi:hypothetical protein